MTHSAAPGGVSANCRGGTPLRPAERIEPRERTFDVASRDPLGRRHGARVHDRTDCSNAPSVGLERTRWEKPPFSFASGCLMPRDPPVYHCAATQEEAGKTPWPVRRTTVAQHDGARRGDEASQVLLRDYGPQRRHLAGAMASAGGHPWTSRSPSVSQRAVSHSSRRSTNS